jgi:hypothetical protein
MVYNTIAGILVNTYNLVFLKKGYMFYGVKHR